MPIPLQRQTLLRASLAVLALTLPWSASAHAILIDSTPAVHATVPPGELDLLLRFNSRIDQVRSRLTLTGPDHAPRVLSLSAAPGEDMLAASTVVAIGAYTLRWQVLAIDGHITRGDVPFTVAIPGKAP